MEDGWEVITIDYPEPLAQESYKIRMSSATILAL